MPDQEPVPGHSARLLRGLIWAGVVFAPLAAIVVLFGHSSGSVRFAVLLIAVSVVLIGTSVLIRNDPRLHRADVEDRVAEEVASLRRELRAEFARGGRPAPGRPLPPPDESDFFGAAPMHPDEDPFATPDDFPPQPAPPAQAGPVYGGSASVGAARPSAPGRASIPPPPPTGAARPSAPGRASIPPATAAVRPIPAPRDPGRREPGLTTGERVAAVLPAEPPPGMSTGGRAPALPPAHQAGVGGRREPGSSTGGRVVASAAAAVPAPHASAAVRSGTQYGRPESLAADFGASNGYAEAADYDDGPSGYEEAGDYPGNGGYDEVAGYHEAGYADQAGNAAGYVQATGYPDPDGYDSGYADGSAVPGPNSGTTYGANGSTTYSANSGGTTYGADGGTTYGGAPYEAEDGFSDADGYGLAGGYDDEQSSGGDPNYRARRHRPSANDTNVGTLADFAEFGGYEEPDERYVRGYTGR
jgi:hypothetical protein